MTEFVYEPVVSARQCSWTERHPAHDWTAPDDLVHCDGVGPDWPTEAAAALREAADAIDAADGRTVDGFDIAHASSWLRLRADALARPVVSSTPREASE